MYTAWLQLTSGHYLLIQLSSSPNLTPLYPIDLTLTFSSSLFLSTYVLVYLVPIFIYYYFLRMKKSTGALGELGSVFHGSSAMLSTTKTKIP